MKVKEIINNIIQVILIIAVVIGSFSGLEQLFHIAIVISGVYGIIIMFIAFAKDYAPDKADARLFLFIIVNLVILHCLRTS